MMISASLLLLLLCCSGQAAACSHGELMLIPTSSDDVNNTGRVEICYGANWEPIPGSEWDDQDAEVACGQLGFAKEGATSYQKLYDSTANRHVRVADFNCSGSELNLIYCSFSYGSFDSRRQYAGIKCLLHKPCQPQISPYRHYTSTSVSFSWTGCSRDKVATALEYLVSCANHVQLRTSTTTRVTGLRPNKRYNSCSVSGIDNLGRLGERASFSFTTLKIAPQFAPYDFSYTFMSSTSILLTWTPPPMDDRSGSITHYEIEYSCQSCQREYRSAQHVQSLTVSSLQSGEEYTFYIAACVHSSCGSGLARSRKTVNVPPTVSRFAARSITASTAKLSWRKPNDATKYYIIEVINRNTSVSETHYIADPATTSTHIYCLHPYHLYEFSIAAFTVAKGPPASQTVWMPQAVPTGGPQTVNCGILNLTTLNVDWTEPHHLDGNGPIERYWVYVWNKDSDELVYSTILKSISESGIQVTSLDPYHNYNCSVAAFARGGLGPFTTTNVWLSDYADTSAPADLKPLKIASKSAHLHWLEPHTRNQNTAIQHYKITIQNIENSTAEFPVQYVQKTSYNITSLHPNYHYTFTVEAVTLNTIGPDASINIKTKEDIPSEAPQNLQATKVTAHSVSLKWVALPLPSQNGVIIGYTVQVLRKDNTTSFTSILISREPFLTVTNLNDDTTYDFSVAANTSIGAGPYSIRVTAKTKNYSLEVALYSLIGGCLLLVLMVAIMVPCVVYYCCHSKLKQCTSKWFTKGSKGCANVNLSEQDSGNDYNLRDRALRDGKEQTPELPNRDYLEDIDFVSKEFDLFFKRKPDLPTRVDDNSNGDSKNEAEEKVSCSNEQPAATDECAQEASHYMSLKDTQEGGQSSVSTYESLKPRKQRPTAYENVNYKEESNSGSHYQPLVFAKHVQGSKDNTSSHYQSVNVKLT